MEAITCHAAKEAKYLWHAAIFSLFFFWCLSVLFSKSKIRLKLQPWTAFNCNEQGDWGPYRKSHCFAWTSTISPKTAALPFKNKLPVLDHWFWTTGVVFCINYKWELDWQLLDVTYCKTLQQTELCVFTSVTTLNEQQLLFLC